VRVDPRTSFYWHAFFLAMTTSFTEVNTVMPALVMTAGGTAATVGALTAVMIGLPLVAQFLFAGSLSTRPRKRPFLLLGIHLRILALAGGAAASAFFGVGPRIIPSVFAAMTVFAVSGAFAGVSYTDLVGTLVPATQRRLLFVRRQVVTALGLLASAVVTRYLLGAAVFPRGYVLLFALAAAMSGPSRSASAPGEDVAPDVALDVATGCNRSMRSSRTPRPRCGPLLRAVLGAGLDDQPQADDALARGRPSTASGRRRRRGTRPRPAATARTATWCRMQPSGRSVSDGTGRCGRSFRNVSSRTASQVRGADASWIHNPDRDGGPERRAVDGRGLIPLNQRILTP